MCYRSDILLFYQRILLLIPKFIYVLIFTLIILIFKLECIAVDTLYLVPFKMYDDISVIKVRINQSDSLNFIFDSGTTTTILDSITARKIGLEPLDNNNLLLSNDYINVPVSRYCTLKAGDLVIKNKPIILHSSFDNYERITGIPIHGIIGMDFYGKYITKIDYDNQILYFNEKSIDSSGFSEVPIFISHDVAYVKANVFTSGENSVPLFLLFDTGDMTAISLAEPFWRKHDLLSKSKNNYSGINRNTSGTSSASYFASFEKIEFEKSYFPNAYINLTSAKKGFFANDSVSGTIGIDILKRFNIIFNYKDEKLYVKPNNKYHDPYRINTTGLRARLDNDKKHCIIDAVLRNSPAENANIQIGDELISINGVQASVENIPIIRSLTRSRPGTLLEFVLVRNGSVLKVSMTCKEFSDN